MNQTVLKRNGMGNSWKHANNPLYVNSRPSEFGSYRNQPFKLLNATRLNNSRYQGSEK